MVNRQSITITEARLRTENKGGIGSYGGNSVVANGGGKEVTVRAKENKGVADKPLKREIIIKMREEVT